MLYFSPSSDIAVKVSTCTSPTGNFEATRRAFFSSESHDGQLGIEVNTLMVTIFPPGSCYYKPAYETEQGRQAY